MKFLWLTGVAMIAFAANSVLARLALGNSAIDPASYTLIRLAAGALMLSLLVWRSHGASPKKLGGTWWSAGALLIYAAAFSFAYLALDTGTGALILFACVQASMIVWGLYKGERPARLEWLGLIIAFGALIWLVSPGVSAPDPFGATLMAGSGVAWGIYSLRGRHGGEPLLATRGNFVRTIPMALLLSLAFIGNLHADWFGVTMAVISGAITSGLGYALWYRVLKGLTSTQGAIVQLSVPALAAMGGVGLSGEDISPRFVLSCVLILGGVALAILARKRS